MGATSRSRCPKIRTCDIPVSRENFKSICMGTWEDCPLNSWKTPRKWMEELLD